MKRLIEQYPAEVCISAADLEYANLSEWGNLELHLLNQVAVVIPGQMTVMELIQTAEALQELAADLITTLGRACEKCDGCQVELLCDLMKGKLHPGVTLPADVLEQSNLDPDSKFAYEVDPETGEVHIVEADHRFDLTDIPAAVLDIFRECGICLDDLEDKLKAEEVVYGVSGTERFSD